MLSGWIAIGCYVVAGLIALFMIIGGAYGDEVRKEAEEEKISKYYGGDQ